MGCPFTIHKRVPVIRSRVMAYAEAAKTAGVNIDIVTSDREIDGPLEWNKAWENTKLCVQCPKNIINITDFKTFQSTYSVFEKQVTERDLHYPNSATIPKSLSHKLRHLS